MRALHSGYDRGDFSCLQVDPTLIVVAVRSRSEGGVRRKNVTGYRVDDVSRSIRDVDGAGRLGREHRVIHRDLGGAAAGKMEPIPYLIWKARPIQEDQITVLLAIENEVA